MATFCPAPFLGPVLGPMIGGFAAEHKGWRWTMWDSLFISGAVLPFTIFLPETYRPIILVRRAEKRGVKFNKRPIDTILQRNSENDIVASDRDVYCRANC